MKDKSATNPAGSLQVVLILAGCLTSCFAVISAALLIPGLWAGTGGASLPSFAGYMLLAGAGIGLMLIAKHMPRRRR